MNTVATSHLDAATLKRELLARVEHVCHRLLPAGKPEGKEWRCGNLRGEPGRSLSVNLDTGVFEDFATGEKGGNLLELWIQARGVDFATALRESPRYVRNLADEKIIPYISLPGRDRIYDIERVMEALRRFEVKAVGQ